MRIKRELIKGYNFVVFIDDRRISCSKVSGIESSIETEAVAEGGRNGQDYNTKRDGKKKSTNTLHLERAFPLIQLEQERFSPSRKIKKEVSVYLLNEKGVPFWAYYFTGCTIVNVSLEGLDASQSNVVMQHIDIRYDRMEEWPWLIKAAKEIKKFIGKI